MPSASVKGLTVAVCFSLLAGCMQPEETASRSLQQAAPKPAKTSQTSYVARNNTEQRAILTKIYSRCKSQYQSNRQGAALISGVLGGSGGQLLGSFAASGAKSSYEQCLKEYQSVVAAGKAKGLTADPLREEAARKNKAALGLLALMAAAASAPSSGYSGGDSSRSGRDCQLFVTRDGRTIDKCR